MGQEEILNIVKENIQTILPEIDKALINSDSNLEEFGASSIEITQIIILTLEQLKLQPKTNNFSNIKTVSDIVNIVKK